jgi:uncharacterized protein (TIGR03435 family)
MLETMRPFSCAVLLLFVASVSDAQSSDNTVAFEVASVKATAEQDPHVYKFQWDPGRFTAINVSLAELIHKAYHLKGHEYAGPSWLIMARYDIVAKIPDNATAEQQSMMLQNLLTERFGLKTHRENREGRTYAMKIANGGPKFKEFVPPSPQEGGSSPPASSSKAVLDPGAPGLPPEGGTQWVGGMGGIMREHITMEELARKLEPLVGWPVKDETGLKGRYVLSMRWGGREDTSDSSAPYLPSGFATGLFGALQSQLGLKLEQQKSTVEVLVVDHAERVPIGN